MPLRDSVALVARAKRPQLARVWPEEREHRSVGAPPEDCVIERLSGRVICGRRRAQLPVVLQLNVARQQVGPRSEVPIKRSVRRRLLDRGEHLLGDAVLRLDDGSRCRLLKERVLGLL